MGSPDVHEFMSLDGVIDTPTWTFDYAFLPRMLDVVGGVTARCTITLSDLGSAGTQLTCRNEGCPPQDRAEALVGVGRMLDALEASLSGASR